MQKSQNTEGEACKRFDQESVLNLISGMKGIILVMKGNFGMYSGAFPMKNKPFGTSSMLNNVFLHVWNERIW